MKSGLYVIFALLFCSLIYSQYCSAPLFDILNVHLAVSDTEAAQQYYIDLENIYCLPSQSISGGCDTGYHYHNQTYLATQKYQLFTNTRPSTESGDEGLLALYCTHISFRTSDYDQSSWVNCPAIITSEIDNVSVYFDVDNKQCHSTAKY